jgi:GTP cyclohydrolase IB
MHVRMYVRRGGTRLTDISDLVLPDVQAAYDDRGVDIQEVGVDQLSYPIHVLERDGGHQRTIAEVELVASLSADVRGTHMSRFVEVLEECHDNVSLNGAAAMAGAIRDRLGAHSARVVMRFPLFFVREAPVSRETARMRVDCRLDVTANGTASSVVLAVSAPITSLCPCSKEISDYGAHSQRGRVEIEVELAVNGHGVPEVWPDELLDVIDSASSAPIYPLLKRPDERYVTMQAYDNPAFVEDVARDVAVALRNDSRIKRYSISVANEESIHDHRAVARVRGGTGE